MDLRQKLINIIYDSSISEVTEDKNNIQLLDLIMDSYCDDFILWENDITIQELSDMINSERIPESKNHSTNKELIEQFTEGYKFFLGIE
ncbi:MAG: hypothetical protein K0S18_155 [Anaerocolumna sp.]|jgi:hypothetical protein|nr:hypothetical protein [Anaerocolumna sp.]